MKSDLTGYKSSTAAARASVGQSPDASHKLKQLLNKGFVIEKVCVSYQHFIGGEKKVFFEFWNR